MQDLLSSKDWSSPVEEFSKHFAHAALLSPLSASYQLADKLAADSLPDLQISSPESKNNAASAGALLGNLSIFLASALISRSAFKGLGWQAKAGSGALRQTALASAEMGSAGLLAGSLQAVPNSEDFWSYKAQTMLHLGSSFALAGGLGKSLSMNSYLARKAESSLLAGVSMQAGSGALAGLGDSYLRAGIMDNRLPTGKEMLESTLSFSMLSAGLASLERAGAAKPHQSPEQFLKAQGVKAEASSFTYEFPKSRLQHGLALDTTSNAGLPKLESPGIGLGLLQIARRPLPRFEKFEPASQAEAQLSGAALKQSQQYVETGLISSRLEDALRLPVRTDSRGFTEKGIAVDATERFILIDRTSDPALRAVIDDAVERYRGMPRGPEMAMDLRNYVSSLMNRYNLSGQSLEQLYSETLQKSRTRNIPIGQFLCKGSGVCLQRSALMKVLADELGMQARLREGFMGIRKPQPHVWTEFEMGSRYQIYDASHPPNPAFRYLTTKH